MKLPIKFLNRFKELMKEDEFTKFLQSLEDNPVEGIRYNSLKLTEEQFLKKINQLSTRIPWTKDGFYFDKKNSDVRLTIHPYYHQGLFYIQEPSAMFPAELLSPKEGEKVLDLCAAPGGKTLQIVSMMNNTGLVVANEISPKRARALKKNIELYGVKNTIITNSTGKNLLETYGTYFDKILVDAPCSGEGTFRKDKNSIKEYEKYAVEELYDTQRDILDYAFRMLKDGGYLVYSTCTFNPEENEKQIEYMLSTYDCGLVEGGKTGGISDGRYEWTLDNEIKLKMAHRFWPHLLEGEGHFAVKIIKYSGDVYKGKKINLQWKSYNQINDKIKNFIDDNFNLSLKEYYFYSIEDDYYIMDDSYPFDMKNKIQHIGIHLGKLSKYNFIPSQSFAMTLKVAECKNIINLDFNNANKYLKGETIIVDKEDGFYGMVFEDHILGFAKISSGFFKNLYDKSWRKVNDGNSFNTSDN